MNSSELKGFLTGLMFGDGYIDKGVTKRRFEIKTIYKDFADKIKELLDSCNCFDTFILYTKRYTDKNNVNHKQNWCVNIRSCPYFAKKYHHFYDDYKKRVISKEAIEWLTPMGIAYWYMSDGYICLVGKTKGLIRDRRVDFCTDRYDYNTVVRLQEMFKKRFDIETSLIKRDNFYRIRIKKASYKKFYDIVFPYVNDIPSMRFKLYFGYALKPNWMDEEMWAYQNELRSVIALTDKAEG